MIIYLWGYKQKTITKDTKELHYFSYLQCTLPSFLGITLSLSLAAFPIYLRGTFTHPLNCDIVLFLLWFVCLSLSLSVCVCVCVCEENFRWTIALILMWFLLNSCLSHWLRPYWIWWPWVKGQGHGDGNVCKND